MTSSKTTQTTSKSAKTRSGAKATTSTSTPAKAKKPGFFRRIKQKYHNVGNEFVEFINRGSIIDLAIGVAVGGAFNAIVNSFVNDIIMPIVGLIAGGVNFNNLAIHIPNFSSSLGFSSSWSKP